MLNAENLTHISDLGSLKLNAKPSSEEQWFIFSTASAVFVKPHMVLVGTDFKGDNFQPSQALRACLGPLCI
jgi:hypothetical protein